MRHSMFAMASFFLGCLLLSSASIAVGQPQPDSPAVADDLLRSQRSARATMEKFRTSPDDAQAAECLDFSRLDSPPSEPVKAVYVRKLKRVVVRLGTVDVGAISNDPEAQPYRFPPDSDEQPIVIARGSDGVWRFTAATVGRIDALFARPESIWHLSIGGIEIWRIVVLFSSLLVAFIVGRIVRAVLAKSAGKAEQTDRQLTAVALTSLARVVVLAMFVVGFRVGVTTLDLAVNVKGFFDTLTNILFAIAIGYGAYCLVDVIAVWLRGLSEKTASKLDDMLVPLVCKSLRGTIIILVLVQIATELSDKPVTSLIAGLGVGGLAIGFAAQDSIKNIFGSVMIFGDRPFELGDRIVVDGHDGPVETVGFRSTRIRTLDGHLVTIPNGELANKTIQNIGKRPHIRRIMNVTITYDTPPDKVDQAVEIIKEILEDHEGMRPDLPPRVFFNDFNDVSLNIFVIYWYHPPDYWSFCAFNERVNSQLLRRYNEEGIEFAFPTQTLFLAADPNRPLTSPGSSA